MKFKLKRLKYVERKIKILFKNVFAEQPEYIVVHKLSGSLICAENKEAKVTVPYNFWVIYENC